MATKQEEIREGIKEWVLEVRQYLCDTEFAPEPFQKPMDSEVLITEFPNKLLRKLHSQGVVILDRERKLPEPVLPNESLVQERMLKAGCGFVKPLIE